MAKYFVLIPVLLLAISSRASVIDDIPEKVSEALDEITQDSTSNKLRELLAELKNISDESLAQNDVCKVCEESYDYAIRYRRSGANKESMYKLFVNMCMTIENRKEEYCKGSVNLFLDTILYIIDNRKDLKGAHYCAVKRQRDGCKYPANTKSWSIELPPEVFEEEMKNEVSSDAAALKLLHLTDIHYDPTYKPGTNANCDKPLCCEENSGPPKKPEDAAGHWGDYRVCDMPWHSVENVFDQVVKQHKKFDLIYYTGDIISHKSWETSQSDNIKTIKQVFDKFKTTFPNQIVYPVLGNHEPHPSDFYSPGNVTGLLSTRWIFDLAAEEWSKWLPADTKATLKKGGYYTVLVKPGFRIIGLNSNVCYAGNLWLVYEDEDPYDQLKWLVEVLTKAEKNKEIVHILSHIPPGESDCIQAWSKEYKRIVNRFARTIAAQFNGHTHEDELRVFYNSSNPKQVVNVAFNGASFTTFVSYNPNYRVYDVDSADYKIQDYEQWIYDLAEANKSPNKPPRWFKLYSFKDAYGLDKLSYDRYDLLLQKMAKNSTLVKEYVRFKGRRLVPQNCDDTCIKENICSITAIEAYERLACQKK